MERETKSKTKSVNYKHFLVDGCYSRGLACYIFTGRHEKGQHREKWRTGRKDSSCCESRKRADVSICSEYVLVCTSDNEKCVGRARVQRMGAKAVNPKSRKVRVWHNIRLEVMILKHAQGVSWAVRKKNPWKTWKWRIGREEPRGKTLQEAPKCVQL